MKRKIGILLLFIGLLTSTTIQAQLKFGIKGGLNITNADYSDLKDNFKAENLNGFFVGPMLDLNIPVIGLGIDGSLLYSQKGTKFSNNINSQSVTNKQHAIEIPINLKYSVGLGNMASIFVAAGPSFSFNIKSDDIGDDLLSICNGKSNSSAAIDTKCSEVAINLGGGVKLLNHLQLGINYSLPLTDRAKDNFANNDMGELSNVINGSSFKTKTKMWRVSVAYLF